jgi:alpha-L-rhamnosidase
MNTYDWRYFRACLITALTLLGCLPAALASTATPSKLRCEYRFNPLGIDAEHPRLSWIMVDSGWWTAARGQKQTAYQILVASSEKLLQQNTGDYWDSGQVASDQSLQVAYQGKPLTSRLECYWKVRIWDQAGKASAWSQPARWTMGLLQPSDWQSEWIGLAEGKNADPGEIASRRLPARWLRREFNVSRRVKRATAYFSGLGLSELYLNGQKVGDEVLSPGLTDYTKRIFYVTHDVTQLIRSGHNAVGVVLGNGRFYAPRTKTPTATQSYGFPKLCLQLEVEYTDGTREVIISDPSWKLTTDGPIRANNEYDGEEYDARLEMPGWAEAGYDDAKWRPAQSVPAPGGKLVAQMMDPIRVTGTRRPIAMTEPKPGVYVFDLGQNMVGWCRLKVRGPAGTAVSLRHAEKLKPDGTLYTANLRSARETDIYTLKGKGREIYEPRFTDHGFRYVEVSGFPGKPTLASLEGQIVNDDVAVTGGFTCSQPTLNRTYENVVWGVRGNYRSIPTDCPQRDERQGWLGDRSAESKGESYLFNIAAFYANWVQDMADSQKANGSISDVCPAYWPFYNDNVTWPSSAVIIPGMLLDQYGDTGVIARQYPCMVKWVDHLSGFIKNGIIARDNYGDWCVPPKDLKIIISNDPASKTAPEILATSYFYHCLKLMVRYATLLHKPEDAARFDTLAGQLKTALNQKFYHPKEGYYGNGSQTACVLPLAFDLVPEAERGRVFNHLVEKITVETKGHIGTGLVGGQWLNRVLTEGGRPDLVYGFATNTTYPSWGYMAEQGATTIWELWNGNTANPAMNSGNHVMLVGDFVIWLYEKLAGIQCDPGAVGFKQIIIKPTLVGNLAWVKAHYDSPYGRIVSNWKREGNTLTMEVTIPANTTATVFVPTQDADGVTESGKPAAQAEGVTFLRMENNSAVYAIGSGRYRFQSKLPSASARNLPEQKTSQGRSAACEAWTSTR